MNPPRDLKFAMEQMALQNSIEKKRERQAERLRKRRLKVEKYERLATMPTTLTDLDREAMKDTNLALPGPTWKRAGRYQDAARLYIHARITNLSELAIICGLTRAAISHVHKADEWDKFAGSLHSAQLGSVFARTESVMKAHAEMLKVAAHETRLRARQVLMVQAKRKKILDRMTAEEDPEKCEKDIMSLRRWNKIIEELIGKGALPIATTFELGKAIEELNFGNSEEIVFPE